MQIVLMFGWNVAFFGRSTSGMKFVVLVSVTLRTRFNVSIATIYVCYLVYVYDLHPIMPNVWNTIMLCIIYFRTCANLQRIFNIFAYFETE